MASPRTLIIIPTYNELENISKMVSAVMDLQQGYHILFIDDNSPDGTAAQIEALMEKFPAVFLEKRPGKLGLGTAYIHGFKWALDRDYTYIIEMDCDFSHNPKDLPRLVKACEDGADCAIGSRYVRGGKVRNWPLLINIKDTTAGFKCYHHKVLEQIPLEQIPFKGYAFQICMKYAAVRLGFKVKEIPITFIDRVVGESKMSKGIFKEAFFGVWQMRKMKWK
jgi:dolichol-phosphate mannosyltransferase